MSDKEPETPRSKTSFGADYVKYSGMAIQMGVAIALPTYLGWYLDRLWSSEPWAVLAGVFLGLVLAFYSVLKDL